MSFGRPDRLTEVRFVPRSPLDAATHAGMLLLGDRSPLERRADRRPEVFAGYRYPVAGTTGVELSPVDQRAMVIEQEEVRGARRRVRLRDGLRLVEEIGERVASLDGFRREPLRCVLGIRNRVVGADRDDPEIGADVLAGARGDR